MQESAAQRALAVPELLECIIAHIVPSEGAWQFASYTFRSLRRVGRLWRILTDEAIVASVFLDKTARPVCGRSKFDLSRLFKEDSPLYAKVHYLRLNRHAPKDPTAFEMNLIRLGSNLRKLDVVDLTSIAAEHAKSLCPFLTYPRCFS